MIKEDHVEIPLSKRKLVGLLTGSIAFVLAGFWFTIQSKTISAQTFSHKSPELIFIGGAAAILFFGLCAIFIFRKIIDNKPGLVINDLGIDDNSSGTSAGFIPWEDIKAIRKTTVVNQNMIMIMVGNPEEYINRQTGFIAKKAMEMNFKSFGSPIFLSANGLKCNFNELFEIIATMFNNRNTGQ